MKSYIVFGSNSVSDYQFYFVQEEYEMEYLLNHIKARKVHKDTKQSLITLYEVIEEDKKYPTNISEMKKEMKKRMIQGFGGFYLIRWKQKDGLYKTKRYNFIEDLELRMENLEEKGITDILILNTNEARNADTFLRWDMEKLKEEVI